MTRMFKGYEPYKGDLEGIRKGVLVSMKTGTSTLYSLDKLKARGLLFIHPGDRRRFFLSVSCGHLGG
jgi:GTP-binding protein